MFFYSFLTHLISQQLNLKRFQKAGKKRLILWSSDDDLAAPPTKKGKHAQSKATLSAT